MAKKFLGGVEKAVGKKFASNFGPNQTTIEVIGVVKNTKYRNLRDDNGPIIYVAQAQDPAPGVTKSFELRVAGPSTFVVSAVKESLAQVNPDIMLNFRTLTTQVEETLTRERLLATLSGFFGGLALLLATIGLYGVMSYNVARRRGEIGIRMALGAQRARVLSMVLQEVATLIMIGLAVGLGAALATTRFVASFLYGIKPNDPGCCFSPPRCWLWRLRWPDFSRLVAPQIWTPWPLFAKNRIDRSLESPAKVHSADNPS
jgi:putative ABC transport system permease protein